MNRDLPFIVEPSIPAREPGIAARLVQYGPGQFVALPPHTTLELVEHPQAVTVPGAARHAHGLLPWQGRRVAMIDLGVLLDGNASREVSPRYALVVAYQRAPGMPIEHGALAIQQLPETVTVRNSAACALPLDSDQWPLIATACFLHDGHAVPIVSTARLFAR